MGCICAKEEDGSLNGSAPNRPEANRSTGLTSGDVWKSFEKGKVLGKGAYGEAFQCTEKQTKQVYCVKQIDKMMSISDGQKEQMTDEEINATRNEIKILYKLSQQAAPYVVQLHSAYETPKSFFLAMEMLSGGELLERVQKRQHYSEENAATLMRTIFQAIEFCHEHKICHRDIKLDNYVFLNEKFIEDGGVLKLIDMGFAVDYSNNPKMKGIAGTYRYMAPEVVNHATYDEKVDVWSVGVIMYCLLCGRFPGFHLKDQKGEVIVRGKHPLVCNPSDERHLLDMRHGCCLATTDKNGNSADWVQVEADGKEHVSSEAKDLMQKLIEWDPKKRLSATEALAHPWLQHGVASPEPITGLSDGKSILQRLKKMHVSRRFKQQALVLLGQRPELKGMREALERQFKEIDENGDGLISAVELQEAMLKSGKKALNIDQLHKMLEDIDVNHHGGIDFEEFVAANLKDQVLEEEAMLYGVFQKFDLEHTGHLTVANLKKGLHMADEKEVQAIIDELDVDHDGTVSYMEFLGLMARHDDSGELRKKLATAGARAGHLTKQESQKMLRASFVEPNQA